MMEPDSKINYENPDEWDEIDRPRQIFAPGHIEEWQVALTELRELLATLENTDFQDRQERIEAEEAIFHEIPEVEMHLRDAWDTITTEVDQ